MWKRWCIVYIVLVVWTGQISQQPIADATKANEEPQYEILERKPRECGCCPCRSGLDAVAESSRDAVQAAGGMAGCPCSLRDSEPAASSLFDIPGQLRALGTIVRPSDPKEDAKPLLHPEVGLANSVIQTLRDATEEEYQDAKARDAARAVAEPGTTDATPETTKNIVTIIMNPHPMPDQDDDIIGTGTHTQEPRCIDSLGGTLLEPSNLVFPKSNLLKDLIHIPNIGRLTNGRSSLLHLDNGLSASDVHEIVVESPKSPVFKKVKYTSDKFLKENKSRKPNNLESLKQFDLRNNNPCIPEMEIKERINRLGKLISPSKSHKIESDVSSLSSNVKEIQSNDIISNSKMKSNTQALNVPIIDDLLAHSKANIENFKIPTLSDLFRNSIWAPKKVIETNKMKIDTSDPPTISEEDSTEKIHKLETEILDSVPNPSENEEVISSVGQSFEDEQSESLENKETLSDEPRITDSNEEVSINGDSFDPHGNSEVTENKPSDEEQKMNKSSEDPEPDTFNMNNNLEKKKTVNNDVQQLSTEIKGAEANEIKSFDESSESSDINVDQILDKTRPSAQTELRRMENNKKCSQNNNEPSEMEVGASERIGLLLPGTPNNILKSLLKQNTIVQPSSLISRGNVNHDVPLKISNNTERIISSFNDLRKGLSNIFGNRNDNVQSLEEKSQDEFDDDISMSSDGSAPKPQLLMPSQDREINLNIFKLNPLKFGEPLHNLKAINLINLNSFKARVKMPNINFKPLKLESTFGESDGLLGTSLSLEPLHTPHLPRLYLPDLEKMRSILTTRTDDFLKSQKLDLDSQTLRNSEPIRKLGDLRASLQFNAENTMNNLQQTLASTLDDAKIKTDILLGNSRFAQPENILDIARFDVDDKLQELHSNLADHLSSVHEKLMNPPPLPSLDTPILGKSLDFSALGNPLISTAQKPITSKKKSSKPRKITQVTRKVKDENLKFRTASGIDRSPVSTNLPKSLLANRNNRKPHKNLGVASNYKKSIFSGTSKPLSYSTKKTAAKASQFRSFERNPELTKIQVSPIRPVPDIKKTIPFRFPQRPESSKFKAALLTSTTISPRMVNSHNRAKNQNLLAPWTSNIVTTPSPLRLNIPSTRSSLKLLELPKTKLQSILFPNDVNGSPSDIVLEKLLPDFKTLKTSFDEDQIRRNILFSGSKGILKPKFKVNISKLDLPESTGAFRPLNNGILKSSPRDTLDFDELKVIPESKSDLIDNPLLSRLVESFKSSLPDVDIKPFEKDSISSLLGSTLSSLGASRLRSSSDMVEGASENLQNAVVIDKPMKENVSYKCRMVCTREK